jgi:hypothetical protein
MSAREQELIKILDNFGLNPVQYFLKKYPYSYTELTVQWQHNWEYQISSRLTKM